MTSYSTLEAAIMEIEGGVATLDVVAGDMVNGILPMQQPDAGNLAPLIKTLPVAALDFVSCKVRDGTKALRAAFDATLRAATKPDGAVTACHGEWREAFREAEAAPTEEGADAASERMAGLESQLASLPAASLSEVARKVAVLSYLAGESGHDGIRSLAASVEGDLSRLIGAV